MSLQATDQESAAVATHPRVTLEQLEAKITSKVFFNPDFVLSLMEEPSNIESLSDADRAALSILTICVLVLRNGFTIVGKSAPASPENFDQQLGAKFAYEDAVRQLWPLDGYLLRDQLFNADAAKDSGE